ncbi:MaoC/PaaZ C-terminal domain-containing protein [[Mycobacterium] vasticus]|uniref:MaoC/PaaZ C-terminal domain-containing protein n=1 Tax=[Mycobacterium] vasticus TaxID=2875777 RepID=A0ABU5Z215_9MYCO|nr:MaoC/PaaZ C-terminal domain-containing protein [Mycolicibacter sp. MYC017]MEB3070664.1 MaoC/PaaZ C-terminal domain-containing protein [Mycolicibacter sp. MYC017]
MTSALVVGAVLPERRFGPQTRTDIVRYQGASGDFNSIHHDDEIARSAGMPGVFSVGMLQAGYLGTYCVELFGAESVRRLSVRFAAQVWPGDELVCRGVISALAQDGHSAELDLTIGDVNGSVAVSASVTVVLGCPTPDGPARTDHRD